MPAPVNAMPRLASASQEATWLMIVERSKIHLRRFAPQKISARRDWRTGRESAKDFLELEFFASHLRFSLNRSKGDSNQQHLSENSSSPVQGIGVKIPNAVGTVQSDLCTAKSDTACYET